ncbi:MAG TPA: DUF61 family protein [Methanomassiliicoccales archaeon]|nr:DUF61 family protein [Methanomassiliicoccales archaeon]
MGDIFNERAMQRLFTNMNQHVPVKRRSLRQLLEDPDPSYEGKDGRRYRLDRQELLFLSAFLDEDEPSRLKLPILIMTDTSFGDGYWKIIGKLEVKVISRIIGREPEKEDEMRVFYPYLKEIRDKLPTASNTVFSY